MLVLTALYVALGILLGAAAVSKLRSPEQAVVAARIGRLPASRLAVRVLGAYELVLAVSAVVTPNRSIALVPLLICATYLGFALFTLRLIRSGKSVSCGCFGSNHARASWRHVFVTAAGALVAACVAAVAAPSSEIQRLLRLPVGGLAVVASAVGIAVLIVAVLSAAPTVVQDGAPAQAVTKGAGS